MSVAKCNEWNGNNSMAVSDIIIEPVRLDNLVEISGKILLNSVHKTLKCDKRSSKNHFWEELKSVSRNPKASLPFIPDVAFFHTGLLLGNVVSEKDWNKKKDQKHFLNRWLFTKTDEKIKTPINIVLKFPMKVSQIFLFTW